MSKDYNINKFTAADIEKYHKGLLSSKERNALEKAALDDPFLADALEGYDTAGVHVKEDIEDLKARLDKKLVERKAVPLPSHSNRFYYLRIAAAIIILVVAGWFVYQYALPGKKTEIAQVTPTVNKGITGPDTTLQDGTRGNATTTNQIGFTDTNISRDKKNSSGKVTPVEGPAEKNKVVADSVKPAKERADYLMEDSKKEKVAAIDKPGKKEEVRPLPKDQAQEEVVVKGMGMERKAKEVNTYAPASRGAIENNNLRSNNFSAQVRGNNNEPIPFANITVLNNNTSTYTDANGRFGVNLTDTVATVEVKSIGYESNRAVLRNNVSNDIILSPSRNQLSEVVVVAKKKEDNENDDKKPDASPVDGWEKYNAYLQNNILVPAGIKLSKKGQFVELLFDINKNGLPTNISVETSLGKTCNREAIRLLKQGPKWKGNTGRIKIYFK